ncbi:unnamed protein product, partial [Prorocentrum cordatum]
NVLDNWWSPLLGDSWALLVRRREFSDHPLEMNVAEPAAPRHGKVGPAIFAIAFSGGQAPPPAMIHYRQPLLQFDDIILMAFDVRVVRAVDFAGELQPQEAQGLIWRNLRRSPTTSADAPLVRVDVIIPKHCAVHCADSDAQILDIISAMGSAYFWPMCTQMLALSKIRALVLSDAADDARIETLDHVAAIDPVGAASRLRWKPSTGGRPVAAPSATARALTATRKKAHKKPAAVDRRTDLAIRGGPGQEGREDMPFLMRHLASDTGLAILAKPGGRAFSRGECEHVP